MMKRGFSLLETVVVMALVSTVIYLASTSFLNFSPKYKLKKATGEIYARLNFARYNAIFGGQPVRVRFNSSGYCVEKFDAPQKKWQSIVSGILEGVTIEANNSPIFYPVGTVSHLATVLISNTFGRYRLTIALSGRIKLVEL